MSKQTIVKRTIGVVILVALFVIAPIGMALDKTDPINRFVGSAWIALWLVIGLIFLIVWLFGDSND